MRGGQTRHLLPSVVLPVATSLSSSNTGRILHMIIAVELTPSKIYVRHAPSLIASDILVRLSPPTPTCQPHTTDHFYQDVQ